MESRRRGEGAEIAEGTKGHHWKCCSLLRREPYGGTDGRSLLEGGESRWSPTVGGRGADYDLENSTIPPVSIPPAMPPVCWDWCLWEFYPKHCSSNGSQLSPKEKDVFEICSSNGSQFSIAKIFGQIFSVKIFAKM